MPMYDYECSSVKCVKKDKPHQFEAIMSIKDSHLPATCPKCDSSLDVKKVILKAFPVSQSWKT